eukprot:PhM_4_TR8756/c0_g1_i1/m.93444
MGCCISQPDEGNAHTVEDGAFSTIVPADSSTKDRSVSSGRPTTRMPKRHSIANPVEPPQHAHDGTAPRSSDDVDDGCAAARTTNSQSSRGRGDDPDDDTNTSNSSAVGHSSKANNNNNNNNLNKDMGASMSTSGAPTMRDDSVELDPAILDDALDIFTIMQRATTQQRQQWSELVVALEYRSKMNKKKLREWIDEVGKQPRPVMVLIQDAEGGQITAASLNQNNKMLVNMEQRLKSGRNGGSIATQSSDSRRMSTASGINRNRPDYQVEHEAPLHFIEELLEEERRYSDAYLPQRPGHQHQHNPVVAADVSSHGSGMDDEGVMDESDDGVENGSVFSMDD